MVVSNKLYYIGADRCCGPQDYHFLADALREIKKYANPTLSTSNGVRKNDDGIRGSGGSVKNDGARSNNGAKNDDGIRSSSTSVKNDVAASFDLQVANLMDRLLGVLGNCLRVEKYKADPDMVADLYYEISNGFVDSPELRLAWLANLRYDFMHNTNNINNSKQTNNK